MSRNWLAVASAEHVEIGRDAGFMQVCHGKATPLRRVQPGDRVVYYSPNRIYSPSHALRGKDPTQHYVDSIILHGTPGSVVEQIGRLKEEIGLNYLMCAPLSRETFRLLADEVLPRL